MYSAMVVHRSWLVNEIIKRELAPCDCEVVCNASSRLEASIAYRLHKPNIALVDATKDNYKRIMHDILRLDKKAHVIAVVDNEHDDEHALHAVLAGAQEVILASSTADDYQQLFERLFGRKHENSEANGFKVIRPIRQMVSAFKERILTSI